MEDDVGFFNIKASNLRVLICILLVGFLSIAALKAQTTLYKYQAIYLLKFASYINWPDRQSLGGNSFYVGVLGNSLIIPELLKVSQNKSIQGNKVKVEKVVSYSNLPKYAILYIPKNQSKNFYKVKKLIEGRDILLVTEDDLAGRGASISFFLDEKKRLKFKVNPKGIESSGMEVSSKLLSFGVVVSAGLSGGGLPMDLP